MKPLTLFAICALSTSAVFVIKTAKPDLMNFAVYLKNSYQTQAALPAPEITNTSTSKNDNNSIIPKKISFGLKAKLGEYPWHVQLAVKYRNDKDKSNVSYCNGAILNKNWIITIADCISNARWIQISVGSIEFNKSALVVYPDKFFIHPEYSTTKPRNNLALLRLDKNNTLNFPKGSLPNFAAVRLPQRRQYNELFEGYEAYFSGYGDRTPDRNGDINKHLIFAEQRIISNRACSGFFWNGFKLITTKSICAMSVDMRQGACDGDGGAPLVINEYGNSTLIGLLSLMPSKGNCGQQPVPAAFIRITSYFDWIEQITKYQFRS